MRPRNREALLLLSLGAMAACDDAQQATPALSVVAVGEPAQAAVDPTTVAVEGGPELGAVQFHVTIYATPDRRGEKIGYLRVGTRVTRAPEPAAFDACQGGFYNILPKGYVCVDDGASTDMEHPLLRAGLRGPDRTKPLPYSYAFVRAIAPRYYRLPTVKEQFQYEMSLERHLRSYKRLKDKWNAIDVGSNDVPVSPIGEALGDPPTEPPQLTTNEKFGGLGDNALPWFFEGGRQIPNVSSFKVPDYAIITNRIKRHAGVALIDAFQGDERHFSLTTDLRLIPTSKLKPGRGSVFHGVELLQGWELPVGFVKKPTAYHYRLDNGQYKKIPQRLVYGDALQLTGDVRQNGKYRMLATDEGSWVRTQDLAVVVKHDKLPSHAKGDTKWIDVSILRQTLVLYQGTTPIYATMVSTGKDGLGDPRKTHSTPRGTFRIRDKHVTTAMDSQVTGSEFELNDVPWVQYFKAGYALHAAYWHTEYGRPRSHGCINLSPIDAYRLFHWTEPRVPDRWHGVDAGEATAEGTLVHVQP